jgi:hypothetical protein
MTAFEEYLLEQGYQKFIKKLIKGAWVYIPADKHNLSTLVNIDHRYIKNGEEIIFGLHEKDKPPTLIWPRPLGVLLDDDMNRILLCYSPEVILDAIKNGRELG